MKMFFALLIISQHLLLNSSFAAIPEDLKFKFLTTKGEISFHCPAEWSPKGRERIHELVSSKFFSDIAFFRVIKGFVAQFGISGSPDVAARWEKEIIEDDPVLASNVAGTLTFATAGPNTRTTQLFVNLVDNVRLDSKGFSPVCKTNDEGLEVARNLYSDYGEGSPDGNGPNQDDITRLGNDFLKANFPKLDYINSAQVN